MSEIIIARRVLSRRHGDQRQFRATFELVQRGDPNNQRPYFSATAEDLNLRRRGDNQLESCGCLHDEILARWPEARVVVDLHLSDDQGVPMHAIENMRYWLGLSVDTLGTNARIRARRAALAELLGAESLDIERIMRQEHDSFVVLMPLRGGRIPNETDEQGIEWSPTTAAKYWRLTPNEVRALRRRVLADQSDTGALEFEGKCMAPRWAAEAAAALEFIQTGGDS